MEKNGATRSWLPTFILMNTLLFSLCGIPAILTHPIPHSLSTNVFYYTAVVTQNFLFSCIFGLLFLPVFLFVKSDVLKFFILLIPTSFAALLIYMNAKVFAFWRIYVNHNITALYFSKGGGAQVFEISNTMYMWIVLSMVVALVIGATVLLISRWLSIYFRTKPLIYFLVFAYVALQGSFIFLCRQINVPVMQYSLKIPYFYNISIANLLTNMGVSILPKNSLPTKLQMILSNEKPLHYPLHPLQYHLPIHPLNVLVIVVDTLRYDMINPTNMPNVYVFAQHANQFLDNLSGGDCTLPGIFSLFYGIPSTYFLSAFQQSQESIVIRAFQTNHYQFGLYASAPLTSPPFSSTVFSTIKNLRIMTPGKSTIHRDIKITEEMNDFLDREAKTHHPFFGFLFYDGPHAYNALPLYTPFHPTQSLNYFDINKNTERTPIYNLYKNAVFFDDQLIKTVLQTLQKNNLEKNTVVIITADHGQEFDDDDNNYWEHASGFSKYQVRTPMIIAWPNRTPKIYRDQTTHFDLAPTLLKEVLGVTNPASDYSVGDDFFSSTQPKSIIVGNYVYYALLGDNRVMEFHNSGLYQFTDLKMNTLHHVVITAAQQKNLLEKMTRYH